MNTYFLSLLFKEKERKKNKASIINLSQDEWFKKTSLKNAKIGDVYVVHSWLRPDYLFKTSSYGSQGSNSVNQIVIPCSLKISDQKFNPYYWSEIKVKEIRLHFNVKIVRKIINKLEFPQEKSEIIKVKIGKMRYKFQVSHTSRLSLYSYLQYDIPIFNLDLNSGLITID
jgi:hypothetical protein